MSAKFNARKYDRFKNIQDDFVEKDFLERHIELTFLTADVTVDSI